MPEHVGIAELDCYLGLRHSDSARYYMNSFKSFPFFFLNLSLSCHGISSPRKLSSCPKPTMTKRQYFTSRNMIFDHVACEFVVDENMLS